MVTTDIKPFMESAVSEVLESMCFISSDGEVSDDSSSDHSDWIHGELDFTGVPAGRFGIAVPSSTATAAAANFLGEDETELSEQQMVECVCELTNMICGTLLAHLDSKQAFTLSPPRHVSSESSAPAQEERIHGTYVLDEGFIYTWLELQAGA